MNIHLTLTGCKLIREREIDIHSAKRRTSIKRDIEIYTTRTTVLLPRERERERERFWIWIWSARRPGDASRPCVSAPLFDRQHTHTRRMQGGGGLADDRGAAGTEAAGGWAGAGRGPAAWRVPAGQGRGRRGPADRTMRVTGEWGGGWWGGELPGELTSRPRRETAGCVHPPYVPVPKKTMGGDS